MKSISVRELSRARTTYGAGYPDYDELLRRVLVKYSTDSVAVAEEMAKDRGDTAALNVLEEA